MSEKKSLDVFQRIIVYILIFHLIFAEEEEERPANRTIGGQVKLSIHYKNDTLTIMVMHVKNLVSIS